MNKIDNNDNKATKTLIANLKKQINDRANKLNQRMYKAAILEVAEQISPMSDKDYFDYVNLPYVGTPNYISHIEKSPFSSQI